MHFETQFSRMRTEKDNDQSGNTVTIPPVVEDHSPHYGEDQLTTGVHQSGIFNSLLGVGVPQVSVLDACVRQSSASSLGDGDSQVISNDGNLDSPGGSTVLS